MKKKKLKRKIVKKVPGIEDKSSFFLNRSKLNVVLFQSSQYILTIDETIQLDYIVNFTLNAYNSHFYRRTIDIFSNKKV